jgi:hypothetical protein
MSAIKGSKSYGPLEIGWNVFADRSSILATLSLSGNVIDTKSLYKYEYLYAFDVDDTCGSNASGVLMASFPDMRYLTGVSGGLDVGTVYWQTLDITGGLISGMPSAETLIQWRN